MKLRIKTIQTSGVALLLGSLASALGAGGQANVPNFTPPHIVDATSVPLPTPANAAAGVVELLINLDDSAHVQNVQTIRDIPSVTGSSMVAVKNWTFAPAEFDGKPQAANLSVDIVFNPWDASPQSIPLPPPSSPSQTGKSGRFVPPQVSAASYAAYPAGGTASGTLVLDVTVNRRGGVTQVSVARVRIASLTQAAEAAVRSWTFKPGTLDGTPITSRTIVAFVFRPSPVTSP